LRSGREYWTQMVAVEEDEEKEDEEDMEDMG